MHYSIEIKEISQKKRGVFPFSLDELSGATLSK